MQKRKFDELISYFNRKVSDMSIDQKYKMELLGMISAIGFAHEKELGTNLAEVSTKIEPLTDKEQRIFLAAMGRERKVCKEVDDQYTYEPYEVLLTKVCDEIERKVKGALWT